MGRALSDKFFNHLCSGDLAALTRRVSKDDTLMLALRGQYINVYYRGGSILKLTEQPRGYEAEFDYNYNLEVLPDGWTKPPVKVETEQHIQAWLDALPTLKECMNFYFTKHPKAEREFQQIVAWENNRSVIANETEYFLTDIEYADRVLGARFDMLGVKWPADARRDPKDCQPVFIEMKYGSGAFSGKSGIKQHLEDLNALLGDAHKRSQLTKDIASQFDQLSELDLLKFHKSKTYKKMIAENRPEVIFLLANHNPRSSALLNILKSLEEPQDFDLRFFVAGFAGYAMHVDYMVTREELIRRLELFGK